MTLSADVRQSVIDSLIKICSPDSRFHFDLSMFIADFEGSYSAANYLDEIPEYTSASTIFITPDNSLFNVRRKAFLDAKKVVVSTYGIGRGFYVVDPSIVKSENVDFLSTLDGLEHFADVCSLKELMEQVDSFDTMITGALLVDGDGVRHGKGHGYFDMECAMFIEAGLINSDTKIASVIHDVQYYNGSLPSKPTDVCVDYILTNSSFIELKNRRKKCGIDWSLVTSEMFLKIPVLHELKLRAYLKTDAMHRE
ncbi:MAG: 5-formyltetrahydrofolate cyclo-ligase [Acidithiobacillus sp.]